MKASLPVWLLACIWGQQTSGRGGGWVGVGQMRRGPMQPGAEQQHLAQPVAPASAGQQAHVCSSSTCGQQHVIDSNALSTVGSCKTGLAAPANQPLPVMPATRLRSCAPRCGCCCSPRARCISGRSCPKFGPGTAGRAGSLLFRLEPPPTSPQTWRSNPGWAA